MTSFKLKIILSFKFKFKKTFPLIRKISKTLLSIIHKMKHCHNKQADIEVMPQISIRCVQDSDVNRNNVYPYLKVFVVVTPKEQDTG